MKISKLLRAIAPCALLATIPAALADYPLVSHRYLADPGALVHNGRLYVYCSNDDDNTGSSYAMKSIVLRVDSRYEELDRPW